MVQQLSPNLCYEGLSRLKLFSCMLVGVVPTFRQAAPGDSQRATCYTLHGSACFQSKHAICTPFTIYSPIRTHSTPPEISKCMLCIAQSPLRIIQEHLVKGEDYAG